MLYGHADAERTLLEAYQSTRMAHAWLIGGPPGIGKATLAYRLARFVLAHPDPKAPAVQAATSLAIDPENLVARRIAAQAQGDLLVLERVINEQTGKLYTVIRVDDVRRSVSFFGSTAGEGGWRIAIVDAVDELQREGANALLKVLEEPPARTLLLLVSHAPGRELPTIRSRCRRLLLRPLETEDVTRAVVTATGRDGSEAEVVASGGGVGWQRRPRAAFSRRAGFGVAPARARLVRTTAQSGSTRTACARRCAVRQRAADFVGLHGHGQCVAVRQARCRCPR